MYTPPTVAQFKARFVRDWTYGATPQTVNDSDIANAIYDAGRNINCGLYTDNTEYQWAYLYLAAHYMVMAFRRSRLGTASSFNWFTESKNVGEVGQSFTYPSWVKDDKYLGEKTLTGYGEAFVAITAPRMVANVRVTPRSNYFQPY
jgi:hypothetical protein